MLGTNSVTVLVTPNGNIHKLDTLGQEVALYSPRQQGQPTTLDAWQNLRVYTFSEELQTFRIFDRFLAETRELPGRFPKLPYLRQMAPDNQGQLWLIDGAARLLHYDPRQRQILQKTLLQPLLPLSGGTEWAELRFYQNRLYLLEQSQSFLWVFDNMGNPLKKLQLPNTHRLGFEGQQAYFLSGDSLQFLPLYELGGQAIPLPDRLRPEHVLYNGRKFYFFRGNWLYIYRYLSPKNKP